MSTNQMIGIYEMEGVRRIEINLERVGLWALIFTNAFFASYFVARLVNLV